MKRLKAIKQEVSKKHTATKIPFFKKGECEEPGYVSFLERDRISKERFRATQEERNEERRKRNE